MKKHYCKRKKVVIDALDGKIINEPIALKVDNVEEYLEKNGFKIIKIFSVLLILLINFTAVKAYDIMNLNLDSMPTYKLAFTLNLLIIMFILSLILIILGLKYETMYLYILGALLLLCLGIMLITNGFNILMAIFVIFTSLFLFGIIMV